MRIDEDPTPPIIDNPSEDQNAQITTRRVLVIMSQSQLTPFPDEDQ